MNGSGMKIASRILVSVAVFLALAFGSPLVTAANSVETDDSAYTCQYYIIRWGDNLTRISYRYGVSIGAIMSANGLRSTRIYAGQRLCIPVYTPTTPTYYGTWRGVYWNNVGQSGTPALIRNDVAVNFNWGFGSPNPVLVFADYFSARWTRVFTFIGGTYRFNLNADDGIRLVIDGNVILDRYSYVGWQTNRIDVPISAGVHTIQIDYVEQGGIARVYAAFVRIASAGTPPQGCLSAYCPPIDSTGTWYGQFYNGTDFNGSLFSIANFNGINFNWGYNPPVWNGPNSLWSARFSQARYFNQGVYRFVARSDDGVRIYVDDAPVVNQWVEQSVRTVTGDIALSAGTHNIRVEYFQRYGLAELHVYWEYLGNP